MDIWAVFKAIVETAIVAGLGILAFHFKLLDREDTKRLGALTVNLTYPLLIFVNIIKKFPQVKDTPYWYILPLLNIILMFGGIFIVQLFLKINKKLPYKKEFTMLSAFQNGAYLPLVVIASLFPPDKAPTYFVYIFYSVCFTDLLLSPQPSTFFYTKDNSISRHL